MKKEEFGMNVVRYALLTYLATAVISLAVVGIIVLINKLLPTSDKESDQ